MTSKKLIAAALAVTLCTASFTTTASAAPAPRVFYATSGGHSIVPWLVFGCAAGIILAALAANSRDNRQLTPQEAWTCGAMFWFSQPTQKRSGKKKP